MTEYTDREIGPLTKAALENYLHPKPIGQRIYELERRIEQLEGHDLDTAIRVSNMERKLNHKGGGE